MNVKPLADRVLVEALEAAEKTAGGLYVPDTAKEKPQKGRIIAAGPGKAADNGTIVKMEVKVGDTVLYGKYSGTEVTVDGMEYLILRESDILAVI
jgi:chaperonin GroES